MIDMFVSVFFGFMVTFCLLAAFFPMMSDSDKGEHTAKNVFYTALVLLFISVLLFSLTKVKSV